MKGAEPGDQLGRRAAIEVERFGAAHAAVVERLRRGPDLIYLATHGIADAANPMDASFLALTNRHLYAGEIKQLAYRSYHPLVVMSACQSGLGKTFNAGVFGLARAWIHAGAAQVVASHWNVDDAATAKLMTTYIKQLRSGKVSRAALRSAMLHTRKAHPDPALWAGFNLIGYPQPRG